MKGPEIRPPLTDEKVEVCEGQVLRHAAEKPLAQKRLDRG
jgi:hypothetical protein